MAEIDTQKIRNNETNILSLINQMEQLLHNSRLAQGGQGSYLDGRCQRIRELVHEMSVAAGASTP